MGSAISSLLGLRSVPKLYYASKPALLRVQTSESRKGTQEILLNELVERRCPSLHNVFSQAWWLPGSVVLFSNCSDLFLVGT